MSEEEVFEDNEQVNDEIEDDDDEQETLIKQELIALVKANPALYAKNWKDMLVKISAKT